MWKSILPSSVRIAAALAGTLAPSGRNDRLAQKGSRHYLDRILLMMVAASALSAYGASAQAQCTDKLLAPDLTLNIASKDSRTFMRDTMCRSSFEQFQKNFGAKTAASYMETYSGKGDFNVDLYDKLKSEQCRDLTAEQVDSSFAFSASSVVPQKAREAYVACIHQQELSCDVAAQGNDIALITIHINKHGGSDVLITSLEVVNGKVDKIKEGAVLNNGDTSTIVREFQPPFGFVLNTTQDGYSRKCTAYVGIPAPVPSVLQSTQAERVGPITLSQPAGSKTGAQWGPQAHCVKPTPGWSLDPKSAQITVAPESGRCAQKPEAPLRATEEEVCYAPMISINAGEACTTIWNIQVRESRVP